MSEYLKHLIKANMDYQFRIYEAIRYIGQHIGNGRDEALVLTQVQVSELMGLLSGQKGE